LKEVQKYNPQKLPIVVYRDCSYDESKIFFDEVFDSLSKKNYPKVMRSFYPSSTNTCETNEESGIKYEIIPYNYGDVKDGINITYNGPALRISIYKLAK